MKFIKSVFKTMKETTWLTGKETRKYTSIVVLFSVAFIAFFAVVDWGIQTLLKLFV